jgi:hypothetical protein
MKVVITNRCDRCKRETPSEIEHTEIDTLQAAETKRLENLHEVAEFVRERVQALPDLIVIFKGMVRGTNHVCDANCKAVIERSFEAIFRNIDPSQRAPRKTRTSNDVPAEGPCSTESSETSTSTSSGGSKHGGKSKK